LKLITRVQNDLKCAVLERDKSKSSVLRMLLSECSYAHEDDLDEVQNTEIIDIISRYLDGLRNSVDDYADDFRQREIEEKIDIVSSYLPDISESNVSRKM